jgi:uncharacterized membrane protein
MTWLIWFRAKTFRIYTLAFILMIIASLLLYPAAKNNNVNEIWLLIGVFVFANLIVLGIKK